MRKSEIFDEFVKIAEDKGLVSSEKSYQALEKNPRADSLSVDDIAKLYQVKNESPKNMNYKNNIMEIAHASSAIVSPAYDRLNGLVENNIERQNIMLNIVNKRNDGLLTQKKHAEHELMMSLIKISNDLNQKNPKLKRLSDSCLKQAESYQYQLRKNALFDPITWGIIGAVALTIGGLYVHQHIDESDEGFELNHQNLKKEVDQMVNSNSNWGVGTDYSEDFKDVLSQFSIKLDDFYNLYERIKPMITDIERPRTQDELIQFAKSSKGKQFVKAYSTFGKAAINMKQYLGAVQKNFDNESYKKRQIKDKGWMTKVVDKMKVFRGGAGLIKDDFDDVKRYLPAYVASIDSMLQILKSSQELQRLAERQIEQAKSKSSVSSAGPDFRSMDETAPGYKPSGPTTTSPTGSSASSTSQNFYLSGPPPMGKIPTLQEILSKFPPDERAEIEQKIKSDPNFLKQVQEEVKKMMDREVYPQVFK